VVVVEEDHEEEVAMYYSSLPTSWVMTTWYSMKIRHYHVFPAYENCPPHQSNALVVRRIVPVKLDVQRLPMMLMIHYEMTVDEEEGVAVAAVDDIPSSAHAHAAHQSTFANSYEPRRMIWRYWRQ
jgi:hypothetical protein